MRKPIFKNKENECVSLKDGRTAWLSRSCAVVAAIFLDVLGKDHVLLVQRGPKAADNIDKYVMPCGFLDYNESLVDAARRELWEEAGIDLRRFQHRQDCNLMDFLSGQPCLVSSTPSKGDTVQNVSHYFRAHLSWVKDVPNRDIQVLASEAMSTGEVSRVCWVSVDELDNFSFAFNHKKRIRELQKTLPKTLGRNNSKEESPHEDVTKVMESLRKDLLEKFRDSKGNPIFSQLHIVYPKKT